MTDKIYLAIKNGSVVAHTDKKAMFELDGVHPEMTVPIADWEAAGSFARILDGQIVLGKTDFERESEKELATLSVECEELQTELAAKDYKVVKASETGTVLAQSDPELHQRREWCRRRISDIRLRIAEITGGDKH